MNVHWLIAGLSKKPFQFLANGDAPPRYRILNFRQKTPGRYTWNTVGLFENMTLTVRIDLHLLGSKSREGRINGATAAQWG